MKKCSHNNRCRYTHGFYCEDCGAFFAKDSPTYRKDELLDSIWLVLHNINVKLYRQNKPLDQEIEAMLDKIGIGKKHKDYEELIAEAEIIMNRYNKTADSSVVVVKAPKHPYSG